MNKNAMKFLLDFAPIVLFFVAYKFNPPTFKPIIFATLVGGFCVFLAMIFSFILRIKMEKFALYSNIAFLIFSALTVFFDNPEFIKAKLTIINLLFALMMMFFYVKKKPIISLMFQGKIQMSEDNWNKLNFRFAVMFFLIAIFNFYFWKFQTEEVWVNFKTFGVLPFMLLFFLFQMGFIMKNGKMENVK
jgi:intracellular septation protein